MVDFIVAVAATLVALLIWALYSSKSLYLILSPKVELFKNGKINVEFCLFNCTCNEIVISRMQVYLITKKEREFKMIYGGITNFRVNPFSRKHNKTEHYVPKDAEKHVIHFEKAKILIFHDLEGTPRKRIVKLVKES